MNYRNKTIFDWNDFQSNNISSITSLNIMNFLKRNINMDIKNIIIRDIENQVGIIIQIRALHSKDLSFTELLLSRFLHNQKSTTPGKVYIELEIFDYSFVLFCQHS